jgi:hypothetical protein
MILNAVHESNCHQERLDTVRDEEAEGLRIKLRKSTIETKTIGTSFKLGLARISRSDLFNIAYL